MHKIGTGARKVKSLRQIHNSKFGILWGNFVTADRGQIDPTNLGIWKFLRNLKHPSPRTCSHINYDKLGSRLMGGANTDMSGTWRDGSNDIGAESRSNTVLQFIESAFFCIVIWKGVRALCDAVITIRSQLH